jgi:tetratricopeptide (TPR) repeat protein
VTDLGVYTDEELDAQRTFLLASITDLDAEWAAGDIEERDYRALRDGYTARAAAVLRLLDRRRVDAELDEPLAEPLLSRRSRWRWVVIAGLVGGFAVLAGLLVAGAAGQRLPGETGSGTTPGIQTQGELAQAVTDFQNGDVLNALKAYDKVLSTDPTNAEALAYRGWLLRLTGVQAKDSHLIDAGLASIQQAERADPSYPDAHFFGGEIYLRDKDDPRDAITEFETYLADNPPQDMGPEVQGELQVAQAAVAGKSPVSPSATFAPVPTRGASGVSGASGASGTGLGVGSAAP